MLAQLRFYTIAPGLREEMHDQFRQVSLPIFDRLGMRVRGPWPRTLATGHQLVYIVEFEDEADRDASWEAFRKDPQWRAAQDARAGLPPLVAAIDVMELS